MRPLNILHLHRMGDPQRYRESVYTLEHMVRLHAVQSFCFVHDADLPLPDYVREIDFDLIVLGPTFLCARYDEALLDWVKKEYDFIAQSNACKIALPQDDYDCAALLDQWMMAWSIDHVYTVCPAHWDVLYPNCHRLGKLRLGFTGYIADTWVEQWRQPRRHADRPLDVVYRASKLPANFGALGQLKSEIVARFENVLPPGAIATDLSVDARKMIPGKAWHDFLESARSCLVTPSGSSLLDPVGAYRTSVDNYVRAHPAADYSEISQACFPGEDYRYKFTAISPRNIEAALAETVQVAIPDDYSGLLNQGEHYIPLVDDCSNIHEVLGMLKDSALMVATARRCKEAILSHDRLRVSVIVDEMLSTAEDALMHRSVNPPSVERVRALLATYESEMSQVSARYWRRHRLLAGARRRLADAGLGRLQGLPFVDALAGRVRSGLKHLARR